MFSKKVFEVDFRTALEEELSRRNMTIKELADKGARPVGGAFRLGELGLGLADASLGLGGAEREENITATRGLTEAKRKRRHRAAELRGNVRAFGRANGGGRLKQKGQAFGGNDDGAN